MSAIARAASQRRRWRPTPTVAASIALHLVAIAVWLVEPPAWPWGLGAIGANHLFLAAVGMWPRSTLLGPNIKQLPAAARARGEIALTFDDGPDPEITRRVLEILAARGAHATFFCIAERAARYPEVVREIARGGHGVENHSRTHALTFALLGIGGFRREITAAQATITGLAGRPPRFFRPPAGIRSPLLDPVLHELGLALVSWTRRGFDTRSRDPAAVAARLVARLGAGDILLLHDGHSARTAAGTPVVLEVLPRLLDAAEARGLRLVSLHQAIDT